MKKEITILTSWKWDIYEIDWNIKDYMNMKTQAKQNWEDWFWCERYQTYIKFASLEKESWKTQYIALEEPKKPIKELTQEDRVKRDIMLANILKDTAEGRKKNFYKYREDELFKLATREKTHWLETTVNKLLRLKEYEVREERMKAKGLITN